eukprot:3564231-Prymnesium_polylepis.1
MLVAAAGALAAATVHALDYFHQGARVLVTKPLASGCATGVTAGTRDRGWRRRREWRQGRQHGRRHGRWGWWR